VSEHYVETTVRGRYLLEPGPADARTVLVGFHGYGERAEAQMERLRRFPGAERSALVSVPLSADAGATTATARAVAAVRPPAERRRRR
jgi:hypothetical protein